jgi:hypothetical protein
VTGIFERGIEYEGASHWKEGAQEIISDEQLVPKISRREIFILETRGMTKIEAERNSEHFSQTFRN